jgi:tRNA (Thr-GGU) A37 N-methylase
MCIGPIEAIDGTPVIHIKPVIESKDLQPPSISGTAERPAGEETIPPNRHNETKQCNSW